MSWVRRQIASRAPWLGPTARYVRAARDALLPVRRSYAQHGEDAYIQKQLSKYDLSKGIYVDVGASHPTTISNTYLFYRHGGQGVTIEPNLEYVSLHRRFRPRDVALAVGCGARAGVAKFRVSKTPVLSRFVTPDGAAPPTRALEGETLRYEYSHLLTLDEVLRGMTFEWIYLLSIDVEGLDLDVLRGAREILPQVLYACVEANDDKQRKTLDAFLGDLGFAWEHTVACNLIYKNGSGPFETFRTLGKSRDDG